MDPDREASDARGRPHRRGDRRAALRRDIGWAYWPFFVFRRAPDAREGRPGAILSIIHSGYVYSGLAVVLDLVLWLDLDLPWALVFLPAHLVWISVFVSLLVMNAGFLQHLDGRPLERLGWANRLTMARVHFLPVLLYLLVAGRWTIALAGYVILALTDVADGMAARRLGEESKLGFVLDPFVDILFHLGILVSLSISGVLSWWTGGFVAARYGLLMIGCLGLYHLKGEIWIQPTPFGKATGLVTAILTSLLLLALGVDWRPAPLVLWIDRLLAVIFAACLVHVIIIGWINFRRPAQGGTAVYRRGWGLLLGHKEKRADGPDSTGGGTGISDKG